MLWTITTQQQNHKQPNQKTGKRLRLSSKDVQMANKHMKIFNSISSLKIQLETKMNHPHN